MRCAYKLCSCNNTAGRVFGFYSSTLMKQGTALTAEDAPLRLEGESEYECFGQAVAVVDTHTLVVGAPGFRVNGTLAVGRVYGFLLSANAVRHGRNEPACDAPYTHFALLSNQATPAFTITPPVAASASLAEFGHAIAAGDGDLMAGARIERQEAAPRTLPHVLTSSFNVG